MKDEGGRMKDEQECSFPRSHVVFVSLPTFRFSFVFLLSGFKEYQAVKSITCLLGCRL